jgi:hypothetical protein
MSDPGIETQTHHFRVRHPNLESQIVGDVTMNALLQMTAAGQVQYKGLVDSSEVEVGNLCYELATLTHQQPPPATAQAWPAQPLAPTPSPWRTEASPLFGTPAFSPSPPPHQQQHQDGLAQVCAFTPHPPVLPHMMSTCRLLKCLVPLKYGFESQPVICMKCDPVALYSVYISAVATLMAHCQIGAVAGKG